MTVERRKYLTVNEVARVVAAAAAAPVATRALILLLLAAGPRVSEALALTVAGIDADDPECPAVTVPTLKRRRASSRVLPVPADLLPLLTAAAAAVTHREKGDGRVWPINRSTAYRWIADVMQAAKVPARLCHPHTLRHTCAMLSLGVGVPITAVQQQLGHANVATTEIYTRASTHELRGFVSPVWQRLGMSS